MYLPIKKRPCSFKLHKGSENNKPIYEAFEGYFHGWGKELQEDEQGFHEQTVAIVELEDGSIQEVIPSLIVFTDK